MAKDEEITELTESANIISANIVTEMQSAYLDYAMSVIVARALPDVRDGLKPVQRRIIYAMQDQGMTAAGKFYKSAAVVGEVLRKYHPHGDTSVYDAMVRMAQDFTLRYPLVHGQGNFGSIDDDPPAAMRYTEAKLTKIAEELYEDIDKETVDFALNDLQNMEPVYLPSRIPNLLLNGAQGIAVGMATNIPPHNLGEIIDGITILIENAQDIGQNPSKDDIQTVQAFEGAQGAFTIAVTRPQFSSQATVEDLIKVIKGPDFPTGGIIYDQKETIQAYATGRGRIITRAKMEIEEIKGGRVQIVVTEIPYQINKATLVEKIADLVRDKRLVGVADLREESSKHGIRIVIELKKDALPQKVENSLYKYTPLQNSFNANMVALVNGEPKLLTLKAILEEFVKHRQTITVRRTLFLFKKAKSREHILLGLKIAIDNIDEVIKLIRASKDSETAKAGLMEKFSLSDMQAQAILDMQLRKLAALERQKIEDELKEIVQAIKNFETILSSPQQIIDIVKRELLEIKEKYADERRTKVIKGKVGEISDEDLVANEVCIVSLSKSGYIKRMKPDVYKKQGRGGKGVSGQTLKEEDIVDEIKTCQTHDTALFFTNKGKVYKLRIWEIPESSRQAKGTALVNFLNISQEERVAAFLPVASAQLDAGEGFVVFGTKQGVVKKTAIEEFANIRTNGILAIKLGGEDDLVWAKLSGGGDEVMLVTANGQSIRFAEKDVRAMGRAAAGVTGIRIKAKDEVIGMEVLSKDTKGGNLIALTQKGYGKKTPLIEYKVQNRGGSGLLTYNVTDKTGTVVAIRAQSKEVAADALIASTSGKVIRLGEKQIPKLGRSTQGVRLIRLESRDSVGSVAFLAEEDEPEESAGK
ncbi:MAG: gyrase subunit A protein [candidate division WWE3 bacterium GW2011_GWB1_47_11]|uniref:DNA gyrase subunit A n=1 Tax=candidate division WWE3 bacterium GW2011_GWB1_47_11 TaxID=1619117 RepID=A0A0G1RIN2_UNCKA|nr:MAG: gyrase subunit A protein [candidate division WWE3 bacterium GW2011_GWB1_47_11]